MNNQNNTAPNIDLIDYRKLQQIESNARQYWHSLRTDDPDFNAAHVCYQQAKDNREQWYTEHKKEIEQG